MKKISLFLLFITFFSLISCNKNKGKDLGMLVQNYVSANKDVVAFGKLSIGQLKDQSKIEMLPMVGGIVEQYSKTVEASLDIKDYVYFSLVSKDAVHYDVLAFAKVNNIDSLQSFFKQRGNIVKKQGNFFTSEEDQLAVVFDKNILVGAYSEKANLTDLINVYTNLSKNAANTDTYISQIFQKDAPIVLAGKSDKIYDLSNDEDLKKVINKDSFKGIYQYLAVNFNKGNIEFNSELLGDANKLKNFNYVHPSNLTNKFRTTGMQAFSFVLNLDFARIEKDNKKLFDYLLNDLDLDENTVASNEMDEEMMMGEDASSFGGLQKFIDKNHPLTSLSNGVLFVTADPNPLDLEHPHLNVYLGSTNQEIKQYLVNLLKKYDPNARTNITPDAVTADVNVNGQPLTYTESVNADGYMAKLDINLDVCFNSINGKKDKVAKIIKPFKSVNFFIKDNKAQLKLTLTDQNTNALESLAKYYVNTFMFGK